MVKIEIKNYCDTTFIFTLGQDIGNEKAMKVYIKSIDYSAYEEANETGWGTEIILTKKPFKLNNFWRKRRDFWKSLPEKDLAKTVFYVVAQY